MRTVELTLNPEEAFNESLFPGILYERLGLKEDGDAWVKPVKRSIDARGKKVIVRFQCEVYDASEVPPLRGLTNDYPDVTGKPVVIVVGAGPAGLFAALRLIELGFKPIVFERGSDV